MKAASTALTSILRAKFKNRIKDWEMQMYKINAFNNELYVLKVAEIN